MSADANAPEPAHEADLPAARRKCASKRLAFTELDSAERHHEARYDLPDPYGRGIMDLLYRTPAGWFIIDFKTDEVQSGSEAQSTISQNGYDRQVARYAEAISNQLKVKAKTRLVFLNMKHSLAIFDL